MTAITSSRYPVPGTQPVMKPPHPANRTEPGGIVHHRHLLPNEIDLLLDAETGFNVQPLREHVRACPDCSGRLDAAKRVASHLADMPLIAPRYGLADRVMTRVPVFVPWYVAARDTAAHWVPTGPVARLAAAGVIGVAGTVLSAGTLWVATRGDLVSMLTGLAGEGVQLAAADAAGEAIVSLFGPQVVAAVQQLGPMGIGVAFGGFVVASLATVFGLKRVAITTRARS